MRGPDRRTRWRKAVYAPTDGMTHGCRVLLLRLSDDMNHKGIVSIPRSRLAEEFGCDPALVTRWVTIAKRLGFLDTVRRGRPHVTAVYQATIPPSEVRNQYLKDEGLEVTNSHLYGGGLEVTKPTGVMVTNSHPSEGSRGDYSYQPSSGTQASHSSVRRAVVESATRSAAIKTDDDETEVNSPRKWEDSA